jgi:hypothetical protein
MESHVGERRHDPHAAVDYPAGKRRPYSKLDSMGEHRLGIAARDSAGQGLAINGLLCHPWPAIFCYLIRYLSACIDEKAAEIPCFFDALPLQGEGAERSEAGEG